MGLADLTKRRDGEHVALRTHTCKEMGEKFWEWKVQTLCLRILGYKLEGKDGSQGPSKVPVPCLLG